jgi:hypothetical protein
MMGWPIYPRGPRPEMRVSKVFETLAEDRLC